MFHKRERQSFKLIKSTGTYMCYLIANGKWLTFARWYIYINNMFCCSPYLLEPINPLFRTVGSMFISEVSTEFYGQFIKWFLTFHVHVSCNCSSAACMLSILLSCLFHHWYKRHSYGPYRTIRTGLCGSGEWLRIQNTKICCRICWIGFRSEGSIVDPVMRSGSNFTNNKSWRGPQLSCHGRGRATGFLCHCHPPCIACELESGFLPSNAGSQISLFSNS